MVPPFLQQDKYTTFSKIYECFLAFSNESTYQSRKDVTDTDIAALNNTALSALNSASTPTSEAIGVAMLSNQLDVSQSMSDSLIRAMELSVNPAVGGNFDVSV